ASIRSTIVCVLHIRSAASDAERVPVCRRSNQLFENACMLFKIFSWFSQKRWAFSRNVAENSEVGRNTRCIIDIHCSATLVVGTGMVCLLGSRLHPFISRGISLRSDGDIDQAQTSKSSVNRPRRSRCLRIFDFDPRSRWS